MFQFLKSRHGLPGIIVSSLLTGAIIPCFTISIALLSADNNTWGVIWAVATFTCAFSGIACLLYSIPKATQAELQQEAEQWRPPTVNEWITLIFMMITFVGIIGSLVSGLLLSNSDEPWRGYVMYAGALILFAFIFNRTLHWSKEEPEKTCHD